jgi:hypothetical protein
MLLTEIEIRKTEFTFQMSNEHKFFDKLIQSKIKASDPFQNHVPCWIIKGFGYYL